MKKYVLLALLLTVLATSIAITKTKQEEKRASLRFSNTQTLDVEIYKLPTDARALTRADAILPAPPTNLSTTTQAELELLHSYIPLRTDDKLAEIEAELFFNTTSYNGTHLEDVFANRPNTQIAFDHLIGATDPVLLEYKAYFDRVRPSYLDPSLTTLIPVPGHAAYPSGHSRDSHLVALMLSDLDPQSANIYQADAARIAHNREIAGLHYPSDSAAGKLLAEQLYAALLTDEIFLQKLLAARAEW